VVPSLLGNQLFPADNPWNQQITNAPVAANSDTLLGSIGLTRGLHPDFGNALYAGSLVGIPFNVVPGTQARIPIVIDAYASESDLQPIPIPANAVIEGDPLSGSQNTSDRHLLVYDKDNNIVYETWNTHRPSEEPDHQWHADSEAVWDLKQNTFRTPGFTSADAAGLPILPGLVRPDEVLDQGRIDHALRFTVPRSRNAYIYPASHEAGSNDATLPRMGERFRLKQSFDISGFSPANQVILQALKDYGLIVADNGSGWYISGEPSSRWDDNDLHQLGLVHGSDFEALDLTPVVSGLSQTSGSTGGGTVVTITGLNFSGGAGQTQVFFGTTPASSLVINGDGSITATAPPHAPGTVDVTVQSPYGTSVTGPADEFTYTEITVTVLPLLFVIGLDGQVYVQKLDGSGSAVGSYFLAAPGQVKAFTAGHDGSGNPELFVVGLDDNVYALKTDGNGNPVGGYARTAAGRVKALTVGSDAGGDPEVFVIGLDDQVYDQKFDASGTSTGGYRLTSGGQVKTLSVGSDASAHPETFVIGLDDQVYSLKFDARGDAVGGYALTAGGRVKAVSTGHDASGHPEVFVIGLDDQVYAQKFDASGNSTGGYFLTAAGRVLALNVASTAGGPPELFVIGLDNQVYAAKFDANGTPASGYALTAGGRIKSLAMDHDTSGDAELFVIGLDDQVYDQKFDAGGNSTGGYAFTAGGRVQAVRGG
jgi:hypothetical protein